MWHCFMHCMCCNLIANLRKTNHKMLGNAWLGHILPNISWYDNAIMSLRWFSFMTTHTENSEHSKLLSQRAFYVVFPGPLIASESYLL